MKKQKKLLIAILAVISLVLSCKKNIVENNTSRNLECELNFSETIKLNKNIKSFLDDYFNDSILSKKMHYYFLVINQEQDSSIITINPIPIDLGIKEVKPISLIKYNNKIIFVSSIIDYLADDNMTNITIKDIYKKSFKKATEEYRKYRYFKRWILVMNNYDKNIRVIKDTDEVMRKLSTPIIIKDDE